MVLTPTEAIDTTTRVFGSHPGFRALHAKGIVATAVFRPTADAAALARRRSADYLQREIAERLVAGPVLFSVEAQIANPGDPTDDPSAAWPRSRRRGTIGALRITGPDSERERDGDVLVFDPTRVTDGIQCSADPVLNFRSRAYSEPVARRTAQDTP